MRWRGVAKAPKCQGGKLLKDPSGCANISPLEEVRMHFNAEGLPEGLANIWFKALQLKWEVGLDAYLS